VACQRHATRSPAAAVYGPCVDRLGVISRPQRSVDVRERAMRKLRHDRQSRLVFLTALACKMTGRRRVQPRSRSQTASGHTGRLACGLLHYDGVGGETVHDRPTCSRRVRDYGTGHEQGDNYRIRRDRII
jgi:hypothetical protein